MKKWIKICNVKTFNQLTRAQKSELGVLIALSVSIKHSMSDYNKNLINFLILLMYLNCLASKLASMGSCLKKILHTILFSDKKCFVQLIEIILTNNQLLYFWRKACMSYGDCIPLKNSRDIHAIKLIWFEILYVIMQREAIFAEFHYNDAKSGFSWLYPKCTSKLLVLNLILSWIRKLFLYKINEYPLYYGIVTIVIFNSE